MHRGGEVVERTKAFVTRTDGVTLEWWRDVGWLTVRGSLPRVLGFTNDVVLSWSDTVRALAVMTGDISSEMTGERLPWLDRWSLWRLDACWGWPCDPGPYIDALRIVRLRGTQSVAEPGSVRWRSLRSNSIFGRFYNKSKEQGRDVPLPSRLELQLRPHRQVIRVDGDRIGGKVADLSEHVCKTVLRDTLRRFRLDAPIPSVMASKGVLVRAYGSRKGGNLWRELLAFSTCGGWPSDYSHKKICRIERECRGAGIGALSPEGTLAPLVLT
jgi:hypothetical protein